VRRRQDQVFTLDQPGSVLPGGDVLQSNIVRQRSKEGNALTQQHRDPGYDQPLNQAGPEKTLDGDAPVHVDMAHAALFQLTNDVLGGAGALFHSGASRRRVQGSPAQHIDRLLAVGPGIEGKDRFIRLPTDDQRVHRRHEGFVAVFLAATVREPIQATVGSSDEAVEAGADENGGLHPRTNLRWVTFGAATVFTSRRPCRSFVPLNSRSPEPSRIGTTWSCISSSRPALRYCWEMLAPPARATSFALAARRARS